MKGGCCVDDTELEARSRDLNLLFSAVIAGFVEVLEIFLLIAAKSSCSNPDGLSFIFGFWVVTWSPTSGSLIFFCVISSLVSGNSVIDILAVVAGDGGTSISSSSSTLDDTEDCELPTETVIEVSVETLGPKVFSAKIFGTLVASFLKELDWTAGRLGVVSIFGCLGALRRLEIAGRFFVFVVIVEVVVEDVEVVVLLVVVVTGLNGADDNEVVAVVVVDVTVVVVVVVVEATVLVDDVVDVVVVSLDLRRFLFKIDRLGLIFRTFTESGLVVDVLCGLGVVLLALSLPCTLASNESLSRTLVLNLLRLTNNDLDWALDVVTVVVVVVVELAVVVVLRADGLNSFLIFLLLGL